MIPRAATVVVVAVLLSAVCAPRAAAQPDLGQARAAIERLIKESGADVAVAFRTLDGPAGAPGAP